ncbi:PucR family transcriptional regulator [Actinomadura parmotrematis]|uniref:PucR family transcriptional regulator ligand-binding domain-containing protein n=1 Tax=Actinomadura parmotrematis TaxID=2864039 RepID=A0ABS7FVA8_9ACTN|nr:PucR family transcriptional regulator [Actinomadura parmotrematis]MBW8484354.1 PucR family transcriptional regulator ligand-binding domain-containing protein [Actinomadura parmotrematis]
MRLRSLLTLPDLRLELVGGHAELDRTIRWVVTTDMLDPGRYLSGRELVLTGLVWRSGPADSEVFVRALARAGVSALAAWDAANAVLPADLAEACDRHGVPLFRVPEDVAFATVTETVVRHLSTARAADLTAVLDRHRRLVAGVGLEPVLDLVAADLGLRCWVLTPVGRVVAGPPDLPDPAGLARAFLTAPRLPHRAGGLSLLPVAPDTTSRVADWFLACAGDWREWPPERRATMGELAAIVALERARLDDRLSVAGRLAQEVVRLLDAGAPGADVRARLELTGLDAAGPFVAVSAAARGPLRPGELRALLREALPGPPVVGLAGEEAVALVPAGGAGDVGGAVREALRALAPGLGGADLAVGTSGAAAAGELRGAVEEARHARRLAASREGPVAVVGHDELATHVLLLASVPDDVRRMFRARLLDPLRAYDREHGADLVATLETFLRHSGSWTRCAAQLHLHVNSVRYRIQRIEELTGRDLGRLEDRVDFFLALRLD